MLFYFVVSKPGNSCRLSLPDDPVSLKYIKACGDAFECVYTNYKDKDSLKYDGKCISENDIRKFYWGQVHKRT